MLKFKGLESTLAKATAEQARLDKELEKALTLRNTTFA